MNEVFIVTMLLTFKLAFIVTILLLPIGIFLGYYLSQTTSKFKSILETLVSMPLVLPPSVLGFYLLVAFSPKNGLGAFLLEHFNIKLIFSFEGLIIASMIFSLPFMVNPIHSAFSSLSKSLKEASYTLGKSFFQTLWFVLIPSIKPSILSAIVITFAHTIGEFGVVLMIGGNIEGKTKVASIAIYDEVESLNYTLAAQYAFSLFVITFCILLFVYTINKKMINNEF